MSPSDGFDRVIPQVQCPYCQRGPLPAKSGPQLCSGCGEVFTV